MLEKSFIHAAENVNLSSVISFMKKCKENKSYIHSFEIIQNGEVKVRIAPAPYSFEHKQQLYSLSKSFTATAVGFLVDDGIIDINDRIVDIFPDKCRQDIGKNLSKMKILHLLSMNTGFDRCLLNDIRGKKDPVEAFLSFEPEYEPGTHFFYNNAATYMLSEIVNKFTGATMYDFLSERLFKPLETEGVYWDSFADGNSQGAVGLHASCDDVAKLGLLYLNKGVYNGKRILSEAWVNTATSVWSDSSANGNPDWVAGYGFQFWKNAREGFRGDGAFGQLCMVFPSANMVFAATACSFNMPAEIEQVYELVGNLYGDSSITIDDLRSYADSCNAPYEYKSGKLPSALFKCKENAFGITFVKFTESDNCIMLKFSDGIQWQAMKFGKGIFLENSITIKRFKPTIERLAGHKDKERVHFAGCCTFSCNNLYLRLNYLDNPHLDEYVCKFTNRSFTMNKTKEEEFCFNGEISGICL